MHELGIDFGSSEFRTALPTRGITIRQPACVATDAATGAVLYVGNEALLKEKTNPRALRLRYPFFNDWVFGEGNVPLACDFMSRARTQSYSDAPDVRLLLAIPCEGQDKSWREEDRRDYAEIRSRADAVTVLSDHYYRGCMQVRNHYMVDHASVCVCYLTKPTGGTVGTVRYAEKKGLTVINLAETLLPR